MGSALPKANNFQASVGRGDNAPKQPKTDDKTPLTMPSFGQQKGANVLDTSQNHYSFQGQLSAPHF